MEELARHAGVPVYNGLTDEWHLTQDVCKLSADRADGPGAIRAEVAL